MDVDIKKNVKKHKLKTNIEDTILCDQLNNERKMNTVTDVEKKKLMIHILDEIDAFCRRNNLTYFLVGGTLLGAIRHKGFIPWDDDIDIGLPREDYETLIKCFESTSGNIEIRCIDNQRYYMWSHAKAIDNRTTLIELGNRKSAIGVYIDVFPFDSIPGSYNDAVNLVSRRITWKKLLTLKHLVIDKKRGLFKNIIVVLGKILYLLPDRFIINRINKPYPRDSEKCDYVCNLNGAWGLKELSLSKDFNKVIETEFEDKKYFIPEGYDDYLKTVYGDYMILPPKEKQVSHHSSVSYWN